MICQKYFAQYLWIFCFIVQVYSRQGRVYNGHDAILGQFPSHCSMEIILSSTLNIKYLCGCTILNNRYVLTAAHCCNALQPDVIVPPPNSFLPMPLPLPKYSDLLPIPTLAYPASSILIRTGLLEWQNPGPTSASYSISKVYINPKYNALNLDGDICLLKTSSSIAFNEYVQPGNINFDKNVNLTGQIGIISGWGETSANSGASANLKYANLPIISNDLCQTMVTSSVTENMICGFDSKTSTSVGKGDSGGSFDWKDLNGLTHQIGVVSWSTLNSNGSTPSVFARVGNYIDWIISTIGL